MDKILKKAGYEAKIKNGKIVYHKNGGTPQKAGWSRGYSFQPAIKPS